MTIPANRSSYGPQIKKCERPELTFLNKSRSKKIVPGLDDNELMKAVLETADTGGAVSLDIDLVHRGRIRRRIAYRVLTKSARKLVCYSKNEKNGDAPLIMWCGARSDA